jgi:pimeloyl-ACP methyl ester carboxylesterase
VRATPPLTEVSTSDRTVVWGHSQGGGAALWAGGIAPAYAPDVPLAGVAALAPAGDLPALVGNLDAVPGGSIFASFVVAGYASTYPDADVEAYVRPEAQVFVREIAGRCLAEPEVLLSVGSSLAFDGSIFARNPAEGAFGRRLAENVPTLPVAAPLLIAQGQADALVVPERQAAYARRLCAAGQKLEYRSYAGRDHVGIVAPDSPLVPDLVRWTEERFAGVPATSTC